MRHFLHRVRIALRSVRLTSRVLFTLPFQSAENMQERFSRLHFFNEDGVRVFIPGPFFAITICAVVALCAIAFAVIYVLGSW